MQDLCHSHSDDVTIQKKISTIISCFIKSSLPPALQIDVPPEQAQRILEKRKELGPYIFREAQVVCLYCVYAYASKQAHNRILATTVLPPPVYTDVSV